MQTIEQLYAEKEKTLARKPASSAGAMARHQTLARVQAEIDYFDQGDLLSKKALRKELAEIAELLRQADELLRQIEQRKQALLTDVFGPDARQFTE
ncbi:hypothetical protein NCCP2716_17770 [Sporosarcina sp. NCCP-2716]|uniref:hypothetical protein n=1 Tax=Sporosarcina sp. NCCP-2716 TaxID=2943679 RepID=UPI00203C8F58|nr:hypothetical protein [Sporosarcina sp. NCCP-2716]GKV69279.1 hypothetical protein NCCP2716_17770 [Sporosarcina sp. NCCP-2716]